MFEQMSANDCEKMLFFYDKSSGVKAIITIYSTALGPAIGGCRMLPYQNENEAIADSIRLAKCMAYKSAIAGIPYGGGKSVIISNKKSINRQAYFTAFGKFINQLGGLYITAIDSGTTMEDMSIVSKHTPYVTGYTNQSSDALNPSFFTAEGILQSLFAAAHYTYGTTDLKNKKIVIKGAGNVGSCLAQLLQKQGANLYLSDKCPKKVEQILKTVNATPVPTDKLLKKKYDIICPCDTSFTVTNRNIDQLQADIIIGATNNQLECDHLAEELKTKNILYCPDYVVNSGGLICAAKLYEKEAIQTIHDEIKKLYNTTLDIIKQADTNNISTKMAADQLAQKKLFTHTTDVDA
jgi:leucine dehydrogenase